MKHAKRAVRDPHAALKGLRDQATSDAAQTASPIGDYWAGASRKEGIAGSLVHQRRQSLLGPEASQLSPAEKRQLGACCCACSVMRQERERLKRAPLSLLHLSLSLLSLSLSLAPSLSLSLSL